MMKKESTTSKKRSTDILLIIYMFCIRCRMHLITKHLIGCQKMDIQLLYIASHLGMEVVLKICCMVLMNISSVTKLF